MRTAAATGHRQRGAALLLGLLLLSLFTVLVTHAWSDNQWHMRIASHELSRARAEAAARAALDWAERWLLTRPGVDRPAPCSGACRGAPIRAAGTLPSRPGRLGETWWLDNALADGFDPDSGARDTGRSIPGTPVGRWVIEEAHLAAEGGEPVTAYYRVVARAAQAPRGAPVVIESIVARPWGEAAWSDAGAAGGPGPTPGGPPPGRGPGSEPAAAPGPAHPGLSFCRRLEVPAHCGRLAWRRLE